MTLYCSFFCLHKLGQDLHDAFYHTLYDVIDKDKDVFTVNDWHV